MQPVIPSKTMIPRTANVRYKPLMRLGNGKDGEVVLAVPRSGNQDLGLCVALKILKGDQSTTIARNMLRRLRSMQKDLDHLITDVRDYQDIERPEWHCMSYIPGYSIEQLLDNGYDEDGMPPTVVFHVLAELVRVQGHLRAHGLTHVDLGAGGNVTLSKNGNDVWPCVKLIDFSGIKTYSEQKEIQHVFHLTASMIRHDRLVPWRWILSSFQNEDITAADKIYTKICSWQRLGQDEEQLLGFWSVWSKEILRLKQSLKDDLALEKLRNELENATITEQDVERMLNRRS